MSWRERGGPPVTKSAKRGFGSDLAGSSFVGELGKSVLAIFLHAPRWIKTPWTEPWAATLGASDLKRISNKYKCGFSLCHYTAMFDSTAENKQNIFCRKKASAADNKNNNAE